MGAPSKKGSRSVQGSVKGKSKAPSPKAIKKPTEKKRKRKPKKAADIPEASTASGMEGSSLANTVNPEEGRETPAAASTSGCAAGKVEDSKLAIPLQCDSAPVTVTTLPGNAAVAVSSGASEPLHAYMARGGFKGRDVRHRGIPVWLGHHFRRLKTVRAGLALFAPELDLKLRLFLWTELVSMLRTRTALSHWTFDAVRHRMRSGSGLGVLTQSLSEAARCFCIVTPPPVTGGSTSDSYWLNAGTKAANGISAGSRGAAFQDPLRGIVTVNELGDLLPTETFGTQLCASGPLNLATAACLRSVPSTTIQISARGGANSGLVAALFLWDPEDPKAGTVKAGGYTSETSFASSGVCSIQIPAGYNNTDLQYVPVTAATRIVVTIRNTSGVTMEVTGLSYNYVGWEAPAPDFEVYLAASADVLENVGTSVCQVANQMIVEYTGNTLQQQGDWVATNVLTYDQVLESVSVDDPNLSSIGAYSAASISEMPKYSKGAIVDGVVTATRVSEGNLAFVDNDDVWNQALEGRMTQAVVTISNCLAPLLIHSLVKRCVQQTSQLLPQSVCITDPADMARAEAVQAVLPAAHPYGEGGQQHSAFVDAVSLAYDAACIAFPRIEQVGNVAKAVWGAVRGLFD